MADVDILPWQHEHLIGRYSRATHRDTLLSFPPAILIPAFGQLSGFMLFVAFSVLSISGHSATMRVNFISPLWRPILLQRLSFRYSAADAYVFIAALNTFAFDTLAGAGWSRPTRDR